MRKKVKLRVISIALLVTTLLASLPVVLAPTGPDWSRTGINSGYAVTTNYHGIEVQLGMPVTAYAGTTDLSIVEVKFRWLKPDDSEAFGGPVSVTTFTTDSWKGQTIRVFSDTQTPDAVGDWGVQGVFYDVIGGGGAGHGAGPIPEQPNKIAIRAQSFYAVPEAATIAAVLAMFGALGIFAIKKKRIRTPL